MNKFALFDMDHTVSDAAWRDYLIPGRDWDLYHTMSVYDGPIFEMVEVLRALKAAGWTIIIFTARPEKWRDLTRAWLLRCNIPFDELLMRDYEGTIPTVQTKLTLLLRRFPIPQQETIILFEDREDVCTALRARGVTTLQVMARKTCDNVTARLSP